jgi:beta-barrel assembly-enhancing protease
MKKLILEGITLVVLFISTLLLLRQVDWVTVFKVKQTTRIAEEKLGELIWESFRKTESENKNPAVYEALDSIVSRICDENNLNKSSIKLHILNKNEINAFALPDGHLVIYSGLISAADNPEELSGVISHELAHIGLNHVMKKLVKEVGLSFLISITTGNRASENIKETAKLLSSTAFDRNLEKEADLKAVDYLMKSKINPVPFAVFLKRLSTDQDESPSLDWISTHPKSTERADYVFKYSQGKAVKYSVVLSIEKWTGLKKACQTRL